jgi:hypothetical protein
MRLALAVALALGCGFALYDASAAEAATVTFTPNADAWVSDASPNRNNGSDSTLQVGGAPSTSPTRFAYLRFPAVSFPLGTVVTRTTLRLYFESASSRGYDVRLATGPDANNWSEAGITFNNRLPFGGAVARPSPATIVAGWNSISVPLLAPRTGVTYVITRGSSEIVSARSREAANKPQLVVEYAVPDVASISIPVPGGRIESKPLEWATSWGSTVADFNGDGRGDFLVGHHGRREQIQIQRADGSFAPSFALPSADRHGCTAGDVNGDGRTDLYCMLGSEGGEGVKQNELWIAQLDGTYVNQAVTWGVTDRYGRGRRGLFFDFDGDGRLDLYITNLEPRTDGRSENVLYLNKGDPARGGRGFVELPVTATGPWGSACVVAHDWNHDGRQDLAVCGSEGSEAVHARLNLFRNVDGQQTALDTALLGSAPVSSPRDATFTDVNSDGLEDLLIILRKELQIRLNRGDIADRFGKIDKRVPLVDGNSVAVMDLTGDGVRDIYVVEGLSENGNAPDLLLAGPSWNQIGVPQAQNGTGDTAQLLTVSGRSALLVTNGRDYARGPVQLLAFYAKPQLIVTIAGSGSRTPFTRPAQQPNAAQVVLLPSSRRCVTRRSLRIHIRLVEGLTFASAAVFLNGKRVKLVKQMSAATPISLRRLPKGRFRAKVVVTTADGRKLSRSRRYRTCAVKNSGKRRSRRGAS